MENLAKKVETLQPCLEYGIVQSGGERLYSVLTSFGEVMSEQAVSCLIQPQAGDTVLLSVDVTDNCFILSVLKRELCEKVRTEILFDGDVDLHVRGGGLSLTSDKDMSFASREGLALASRKISVHADKGVATIGKLSFIGKILQSQVKRIKVIANTVENSFRRLTQRMDDSFRFVKEHEEVQSKSARYLVEDTLTMHSKNAVHMAEEIVAINAEQVHLG